MIHLQLSLKKERQSGANRREKHTARFKEKFFINAGLEYWNTKKWRITALISLLSQTGSRIKTL